MDKKRIRQSAIQKRKALIEISQGAKASETIINETKSTDKKYASKMQHKWKKDAYCKKPDMFKGGFGNDLSEIDIDYDINAFDFDGHDEIEEIYNTKKEEQEKSFIKFSEGYSVFSDLCKMHSKQKE